MLYSTSQPSRWNDGSMTNSKSLRLNSAEDLYCQRFKRLRFRLKWGLNRIARCLGLLVVLRLRLAQSLELRLVADPGLPVLTSLVTACMTARSKLHGLSWLRNSLSNSPCSLTGAARYNLNRQ